MGICFAFPHEARAGFAARRQKLTKREVLAEEKLAWNEVRNHNALRS